jgi:TonB family protein
MFVEMEIRADGSVGLARVFESNLGSPEFEKAVEQKIENWTFRPVPDSLGSLTIRYPFEFYAEE